MAKIVGTEGLTTDQVMEEVRCGGKFVYFPYVVSILVLTFRRGSDIHFIRAGENAVVKGLPYTLLTFVAGWWGLPWGLIRTPIAIVNNLSGGIDVTQDVMSSLGRSPVAAGPPANGGGGGNPW